jgi:putative copper export protein
VRGLYLSAVALHVLAASAWIGAMLVLVAAVVPVLRRPEHRALAPRLLTDVAGRLRSVTWLALALLVVTGVLQVLYRVGAPALADAAFWGGWWGRLLAAKLAAVVCVLGLAAVHDFRIGPRAAEAMQARPDAPETQRLRRAAGWMGRVTLLLSLAALSLGVLLTRGLP